MEFFNVCTKRTYESRGEQKTVWLTVGTLKILDDGKKFLELNMHPDTSFYIFDQKKKETTTKSDSVNDVDWDK